MIKIWFESQTFQADLKICNSELKSFFTSNCVIGKFQTVINQFVAIYRMSICIQKIWKYISYFVHGHQFSFKCEIEVGFPFRILEKRSDKPISFHAWYITVKLKYINLSTQRVNCNEMFFFAEYWIRLIKVLYGKNFKLWPIQIIFRSVRLPI